MMAIFTLGADEIRIKKMQEIASAWGISGKYTDAKRLLDDVKKKQIAYVLVIDPEAIEEDIRKQLKEMNVQIINFHDKKRLEGLIRL